MRQLLNLMLTLFSISSLVYAEQDTQGLVISPYPMDVIMQAGHYTVPAEGDLSELNIVYSKVIEGSIPSNSLERYTIAVSGDKIEIISDGTEVKQEIKQATKK